MLPGQETGQEEGSCSHTPHEVFTVPTATITPLQGHQEPGFISLQGTRPAPRLTWCSGLPPAPGLRGVLPKISRTQQGADRQVEEETDVESMWCEDCV